MILQSIAITNFRNMNSLTIFPEPGFNLIWGENGSGKTSLLEAIYITAIGRSFRTRHFSHIINYNAESFILFSNLCSGQNTISVGIEKSKAGDFRIRLDGENCYRSADLASLLPIQLINPDSYLIIEGGPNHRRQFIDWGLFHVEQSFYSSWKRLQQLLKQRNALLKRAGSSGELEIWNDKLVTETEKLDLLRENYFSELIPAVQGILLGFDLPYEINFSYFCGWDKRKPYMKVLQDSYDRDKFMGFTQYGAHRADLRMQVGDIPVEDVLSRGQQKLLVCSLALAQGQTLKKLTGKQCVYLVDDLASELDEKNRGLLLESLGHLDAQVFITGVDNESLTEKHPNVSFKMFHVEQGVIGQ